jgi:hypothetical protein
LNISSELSAPKSTRNYNFQLRYINRVNQCNYYTSIDLTHQTHLVGTLRSNRKLNPKAVIDKKLKKGETVAAESNTGVVIQKWKDKRDVLTLSTKHTNAVMKITCGRKEIEKPAAVIDYNNHKAYIYLSDQMKAYTTSLRRGVKWYRKLAIELLAGSALVNAFILHQEVANEKMSITKFKEEVASNLLQIVTPGTETWKKIAHDFVKRWNFPHCIGAIDGKHIAMQAQNNSGAEHFNYKDFHSLVLLAACDANYVFTVVDIGAANKQNDAGIFRNSLLGQGLSRNLLGVPLPEKLPRSTKEAPYVIVGDEAFPLTNYVLRPYPGRGTHLLPPHIRIFNYRLSRARRVIENAFGILVSRWRIFRRPVIGKKKYSQ